MLEDGEYRVAGYRCRLLLVAASRGAGSGAQKGVGAGISGSEPKGRSTFGHVERLRPRRQLINSCTSDPRPKQPLLILQRHLW